MQNTENMIYFNFSYFALRLLGKGLYSNHWTAIAELVANGIDARAKSVKIYINMVDKEHSVIEVFDNGYGMNYEDLAEKYALIGKDKRADEDISEEVKEQLMGRKGIGKLAALYMSNKYYLISKTKETMEEAWCLDASSVKDSDVPHLDKVQLQNVGIEAIDEWKSFHTGTMIKLTNVDLTNIGVRTIEGLKAKLADFYLLAELEGKIEVAVLMDKKDPIKFEEVKKSIAFKNLCAVYNNSDFDIKSCLAKGVKVTSSVDFISNKSREVVLLNSDEFSVRGKRNFQKPDGSFVEKEYYMKGWIGIHTSIKKEDAERNDKEFLRNKAYRPTQLRLYVRKKLAVENFLEYVKNTQALNNYIEGEISFDILDDNELGDIATSNRQGFTEDDERVILLVELLKPIINSLIKCRIRLGNQVRDEEKEYYAELERQEKIKRQEEERKRELEEQKRKEAEQKRQEAIEAKLNAERKRKEAEKKVENLALNLGSEKKRNSFLMDSLGTDQIEFTKRLHMFKINISIMNKLIKTQIMKLQRNRFKIADAWNTLKTMSYYTARMQAVLTYSPAAMFDTKEEFMMGDLFEFIDEYNRTILYRNREVVVHTQVRDNSKCEMRFAPQDISVILENVLSNSLKHNARNLYINMYTVERESIIDLDDDGDGVEAAVSDLDELFEYGKSYTDTGTGVGLYNVKEIVENILKGKVRIINKADKGFKLQIRI